MHNILVVPLAPFPRSKSGVPWKPTHADWQVDRPRSGIELAFPVVSGRRRSGVREPVQHDVVEDLIFAVYLLHISIMMSPLSNLLVHPRGLCDWRVGKPVPEGLRPRRLLSMVSVMALISFAVSLHRSFFAFFVFDWCLGLFLQISVRSNVMNSVIMKTYLWLKENGIHVDTLQPFWRFVTKVRRYMSAPIAALSHPFAVCIS